MQTHPKLSLIEHFQDLPDPRVPGRTDHDLINVLILALCTLLCGGTGFDDMADFGQAKQAWFKTFLTSRHGDTRDRGLGWQGPAPGRVPRPVGPLHHQRVGVEQWLGAGPA